MLSGLDWIGLEWSGLFAVRWRLKPVVMEDLFPSFSVFLKFGLFGRAGDDRVHFCIYVEEAKLLLDGVMSVGQT